MFLFGDFFSSGGHSCPPLWFHAVMCPCFCFFKTKMEKGQTIYWIWDQVHFKTKRSLALGLFSSKKHYNCHSERNPSEWRQCLVTEDLLVSVCGSSLDRGVPDLQTSVEELVFAEPLSLHGLDPQVLQPLKEKKKSHLISTGLMLNSCNTILKVMPLKWQFIHNYMHNLLLPDWHLMAWGNCKLHL